MFNSIFGFALISLTKVKEQWNTKDTNTSRVFYYPEEQRKAQEQFEKMKTMSSFYSNYLS